MVPPCSGRITRVPPYSSSVIALLFYIRGYHPLWPAFPNRSARVLRLVPTGLFPVRSPLLRESRLISFPPVTKMFQFTGFASTPYVFRCRYRNCGGFPHSDILGSKFVANSPRLIAGCHVFHRLLPPRHPPCALIHLTI